MRRISAEIASADTLRPQEASATVNLTRSLVELKQVSQQIQASTKVVRTADLMIGSLLDIKA